ncbi:MAG TPA: hypothetical protein PKA90_07160 [Ignavibacteria bacterium]|nr:hypothetical protein [Ignavibacteria bacterium]HMR40195.1 hypothetical protein [Ignavibacteria bacterium]
MKSNKIKIHLIRSPEYSSEDLTEVYELLNSFKGPMNFEMNDHEFNKKDFYFLNYDLYPRHNFKFDSDKKKKEFIKELGYPLSFEELFSLCDSFRKENLIGKNDFVVLITKRFNSLNWFSHCNNKKNVFIHAAEWEKFYIKAHHKYPVAYQVVENVLQNLMDIESLDGYNDFVHYHVRGCINDFCKDKREVILKLRTADICGSCMKRILNMNIPNSLIDQVFQILEGLRAQFLFNKAIKRFTGPYGLIVNDDYKLLMPHLGNTELKLEPLFKALYILFLKNPDGIRLNDLYNYKEELKNIYKRINLNVTPEEINNRIIDMINPVEGSFNEKKSKINRRIKDQLGKTESEHFKISGNRGMPFKINLSPANIDIRI